MKEAFKNILNWCGSITTIQLWSAVIVLHTFIAGMKLSGAMKGGFPVWVNLLVLVWGAFSILYLNKNKELM